MEYTTTITKKWQMTIPKKLREKLGITKPGKVTLFIDKKKKSVTFKLYPSFLDLAGKYKPRKNKDIPIERTRDYMEKNYERV